MLSHKPHPLAAEPILEADTSADDEAAASSLCISSDFILWQVIQAQFNGRSSRFRIWNWKTGTLLWVCMISLRACLSAHTARRTYKHITAEYPYQPHLPSWTINTYCSPLSNVVMPALEYIAFQATEGGYPTSTRSHMDMNAF